MIIAIVLYLYLTAHAVVGEVLQQPQPQCSTDAECEGIDPIQEEST